MKHLFDPATASGFTRGMGPPGPGPLRSSLRARGRAGGEGSDRTMLGWIDLWTGGKKRNKDSGLIATAKKPEKGRAHRQLLLIRTDLLRSTPYRWRAAAAVEQEGRADAVLLPAWWKQRRGGFCSSSSSPPFAPGWCTTATRRSRGGG
jgi:hypothetical protein